MFRRSVPLASLAFLLGCCGSPNSESTAKPEEAPAAAAASLSDGSVPRAELMRSVMGAEPTDEQVERWLDEHPEVGPGLDEARRAAIARRVLRYRVVADQLGASRETDTKLPAEGAPAVRTD